MPGLDNQPDLCIDKNGTLHCVFTHKLASNWRKIYYTKSTNDGETWTTPEDISQNPDTSFMNPHIVADTNNILYVTYDYNTGNPAMTLIYLKTFDGDQWSEPFVVSEGMYNSDNNRVYLNNNNMVYVFWLFNNQLVYYRYFESNTWSEIICPFPGDHDWMLFSAVIDHNNNIHCVGYYSNPGPPVFPQSIVYFKYEYLGDFWTENTVISINASGGGADIDINLQQHPHIAYRQSTIEGSTPYEDSTMYTYFSGNFWSEPELVVNDPFEQKITIDPYNRAHIIDREKLDIGYKLVHYQKINDLWQGYIIDEADNYTGFPDLTSANGQLYLLYNKSDIPEITDIYISKFDITTGIDAKSDITFIAKVNIYPNPFKTHTTIEFTTTKEQNINVSIFNLNGEHIKTLMNENTSSGGYRLIWNGKGKKGKEDWVIPGLYLVRLQSGRNIVTKAVEYIR